MEYLLLIFTIQFVQIKLVVQWLQQLQVFFILPFVQFSLFYLKISSLFQAGVVALMLEASRPRHLSSQDISHILVETSTFPSSQIIGERNGAGLMYHDQIGFGYIDAGKAVRRASTFPGITKMTVKSFINHSLFVCKIKESLLAIS